MVWKNIDAAAEILDSSRFRPSSAGRPTWSRRRPHGQGGHVKKGQFLSPWDVAHIIEKITATGHEDILITERGASFGTRIWWWTCAPLPIMRGFGYPVIFDATHSVQLPGGGDGCSSGDRRFVAPLARSAVAAGVDGVFMEVHPIRPAPLRRPQFPASGRLSRPDRRAPRYRPSGQRRPEDDMKTVPNGCRRQAGHAGRGRHPDGRPGHSGDNGIESKHFHVRDGHGIRLLQRAGLTVGHRHRPGQPRGRIAREELGNDLIYQPSGTRWLSWKKSWPGRISGLMKPPLPETISSIFRSWTGSAWPWPRRTRRLKCWPGLILSALSGAAMERCATWWNSS